MRVEFVVDCFLAPEVDVQVSQFSILLKANFSKFQFDKDGGLALLMWLPL